MPGPIAFHKSVRLAAAVAAAAGAVCIPVGSLVTVLPILVGCGQSNHKVRRPDFRDIRGMLDIVIFDRAFDQLLLSFLLRQRSDFSLLLRTCGHVPQRILCIAFTKD
jgi:hypothetical protein